MNGNKEEVDDGRGGVEGGIAREWTGMDFASSTRSAEDKTG